MKNDRLPAKIQRGKKFGMANQMAYEQSEKLERENLKKKVGKAGLNRAPRRAPAKDPTGMSGGTVGSTLRANFSGMSRDKGRSARRVGY